MNTIGVRVKFCAALIGCAMVLMAPSASSYAVEKTFRQEMKAHGKTTAPIDVSYTVPESLAIGANVNVVVTITALDDVADLGIRITAGDGLTLNAGELVKNYGAQNRGAVFSETITAMPKVGGILYLNVFVGGSFHGKNMVRASAVPLSVGGAPEKMMKKSGAVERDSSGRNIVILPADGGAK